MVKLQTLISLSFYCIWFILQYKEQSIWLILLFIAWGFLSFLKNIQKRSEKERGIKFSLFLIGIVIFSLFKEEMFDYGLFQISSTDRLYILFIFSFFWLNVAMGKVGEIKDD